MSVQATQERVRITAYFQGEVKHQDLPLSLGRVLFKLPDSQTEIDLLLPDRDVRGRFQPLKFCVRKKGDLWEQQLEGLRITAGKANNFVMSIYVFEPGPKVGPRILQPNGTIWQQETVRRSVDKVPVTRPTKIEPGAHYRLEINSEDGCSAKAHLVKIEGPIQKSKAMGDDSQLFQTVYPSITGLLRLKVMESKMRITMPSIYANRISFKSGGKDQYSFLLGAIYNDVYVRFIDIIIANAKKYVGQI